MVGQTHRQIGDEWEPRDLSRANNVQIISNINIATEKAARENHLRTK